MHPFSVLLAAAAVAAAPILHAAAPAPAPAPVIVMRGIVGNTAEPTLYRGRLPQNPATRPQHRLQTAWWAQRFKANRQAAQTQHDTVLLGDSITHNWERKAPDLQKKYFGDAVNMGFSGDQTCHLLWRVRKIDWKTLKPKRIMLMIGTNNSGSRPRDNPKDIYQGILAILRHLRQEAPDAEILLLKILPRAEDPKDPRRLRNEGANAMLEALDADPKIAVRDIGSLFLTPEGRVNTALMPDRLHPNHEGHRLWAEAVAKEFMRMGTARPAR